MADQDAEAILARAQKSLNAAAASSKKAIAAHRRALSDVKAAEAVLEAERMGTRIHLEGKDPRRPKP